jgi:hypothetical protein
MDWRARAILREDRSRRLRQEADASRLVGMTRPRPWLPRPESIMSWWPSVRSARPGRVVTVLDLTDAAQGEFDQVLHLQPELQGRDL